VTQGFAESIFMAEPFGEFGVPKSLFVGGNETVRVVPIVLTMSVFVRRTIMPFDTLIAVEMNMTCP
jgi:hypothetical protein